MGKWSSEAKELSVQLHNSLTISNIDWHKSSSNKNKRAAELMAGAIVQLINNNNSVEAIELASQSIKWLKGEVKAPICGKTMDHA